MIKYRRNEGEKMGKGVFYKINNDTITIFPDTFDYVLPSREVIHMINEQKIKNIIIGDGIVRIPLKFFENCYSISKVILPQGLGGIESHAFKGCNNLKEINIPNTVKYLGVGAFDGCSSLEKIKLFDDLEHIPALCFSNCSSLKEISLPGQLISIGEHAFNNCKKINNFILPNTLEKIGVSAFKSCSGLKKIKLNEGLKKIDKCVFFECGGLESVEIPSTVKQIEECAFFDCYSLEEIIFNEGLEKIGINSFEKCDNLKKIYLPSSLSVLDYGAFEDCKGLEDVRFGRNINFFDASVFRNTPSFKAVLETDSGDKTIEDYRFITNRKDYFCLYDYEEEKYKFYYKGQYNEFNPVQLLKNVRISKNSPLLKEDNIIHLYYWIKKNKFLPHEDIIFTMPFEDVDMFYINDNCKKWAELLNILKPSTSANKITFFKLCYVLGVFQESAAERDKAVEFIKEYILKFRDQYEIHFWFDGFDIQNGFDPMYAEFFMKYFADDNYFMDNYTTGQDFLTASYNNFKHVREIYPNRVINTNREADILLPIHVMSAITYIEYENIENEELARLLSSYGYTQNQFETIQSWFKEANRLSREKIKLFISKDDIKDDQINYELLEKDNPLGAVLGNITNCCQKVGGQGESCVKYGITQPNSKFMIFSVGGKIIGQSWVWYDEKEKTICLDNIEIPKKVISVMRHDKKLRISFIKCLNRVASNFVDEMDKHGLEVKNVTIGRGYNDFCDVLDNKFNLSQNSRLLNDYNGYSDAKEQYVIYNKKR